MIKKITGNEYLQRYENMSLTEQQEYLVQVQAWKEKEAPTLLIHLTDPTSGFQNVIQCSASWNDTECEAFQHGIRLLTAKAHEPGTWLPEMVYIKTATRVIKWMVGMLSAIDNGNQNNSELDKNDQTAKQPNKPAPNIPKNQTSPLPNSEGAGAGVLPVRPKHIDQYVHLLPKKTQERASLVKDLLQQIDVARENARLLMNDEKSSPADRAKWASLATKCDKEVRSIYKELDKEWDKLVNSGKVMVDDLGNARIIDGNVNGNDNSKSSASAPAGSASGETNLPNDQTTNRRRQLRKWLVDTRRGNGDTRKDHVKKWKETFKEYVSIEGDAAYEDEKIIAAAKHYGIDIKKIKLRKAHIVDSGTCSASLRSQVKNEE